ncbi:hypothetical protein ACP4OV_006993 [Aristida adscensionis]
MELGVQDVIVYGSLTLVLGWLLHMNYRWMNPPCNGRLPPGSMGLPLIGETFQILKRSYSFDIPDYFKLRMKRYGLLFKSSFVGQPVVFCMDPEVSRFIFQQEDKLFRSWYPETLNRIVGKKTFSIAYGDVHKHARAMAAPIYAPKHLKEAFIVEIESIITDSLRTWADEPSIELKEAVNNMMFDLMIKKLIGFEPGNPKTMELRKNIIMFFKGLISFPLYFPGTKFYQSMKARKIVQKMIRDLLKQRTREPEKENGDFLDIVVQELQSERDLMDEDFMVDFVAGLIFASIALTPTVIAVGMKLLTDNPNVVEALTLEKLEHPCVLTSGIEFLLSACTHQALTNNDPPLQEEHTKILENRHDTNSKITWEEYKSMKFTSQVINEIARLSSHSLGIFRKTLKDVEVNGYTIPAGWLVMISPMSIHLNPQIFEDPLTFNPWRWKGESSLLKNFMPFGNGKRQCLGSDFTKLEIALFLHVLVTKYRWREIKGGEVYRVSELIYPQDHHIQLIPKV